LAQDSWTQGYEANNKFGQDVRIMKGDQGGDAAKSFNVNFLEVFIRLGALAGSSAF
jgi:hypothetical protein